MKEKTSRISAARRNGAVGSAVRAHDHGAERQRVVTMAVVRAADHLGLTSKVLGNAIGLSEASVSRLRGGQTALNAGTKPYELALLLLRLFRSLDAIVGGDRALARGWLTGQNTALGRTPVSAIQTVTGLTDAILYLDARRARV